MSSDTLSLRVTTAQQAAACDQAAIVHGTPSFTLMLRAGTLTASRILHDAADRLTHGVAVYAGSGNNGGDAYVVAAQLAHAGVRVTVIAAGEPRTDDAMRAAAIVASHANALLTVGDATGHERLVVDGLLGTGHRGEFRSPIDEYIEHLHAARARGATIWALDIPSGLDATTGARAAGVVAADVTTTYGSVKRGLLSARDLVGRVVLIDIGIQTAHAPTECWQLADARDIATRLPPIAWDAHKGTRGTVAIVGGSVGMAGAVVMAARGALRAGAGLVRAVVEDGGVSVLQQALPQAIARGWPTAAESNGGATWGHALVIGPGLGQRAEGEVAMRRALELHADAPVLLDADALNLVAAEGADIAARVRAWCGPRSCVITPHPGEFARLSGVRADASWIDRTEAAVAFARAAQVTVVLKGTPTTMVHPVGDTVRVTVVPRGSAALATGGSGDLLSGVIGALLAQRLSAFDAALLGITAHGLAGERAAVGEFAVRGTSLDDVTSHLAQVWRDMHDPAPLGAGVLAEWPSLA